MSKLFQCQCYATRREEMNDLLYESSCSRVAWKSPQENGFYQTIVIAAK